jgi:N6-adenosine-specific RNA methylase IME4
MTPRPGADAASPNPEIRSIGLNGISVLPDRLRRLRPEVVDKLAESMQLSGQLHPIILRRRGGPEGTGFILVAGRHRYEAAVKLNWESIRAEIREDLDAPQATLIEIDENLARADLSLGERLQHYKARKPLYERLNPQTKHGGAPGKRGGGKKARAKGAITASFAQDVASKTGRSIRAVQLDSARAEKLEADVLSAIVGTNLEQGAEVDALIRLPAEVQRALVEQVKAGKKVSARTVVKQRKREEREKALAKKTEAAAKELGGSKLYSVIYADPPWRFEPWSRETGMDRAADNHYPSMTDDEICALKIPAAPDCALFLCATAPMLAQAFKVMEAWGFKYKSIMVWIKNREGTGYWFRNQVEFLLVGIKGKIPAPAMGEQPPQVVHEPVGRHSEKPTVFAETIEKMFPNLSKVELFARKQRPGWATWGNEAPETGDLVAAPASAP